MAEDDSRALFFKAVSLQQEGKAVEAEAVYRDLLSRNPRVVSAHNNLGMLLNAAGRLEEAAGCFRAAIDIRPDHPEALNNLGIILRRRHDYPGALALFQRALSARTDNIETLINMADTAREIGQAAESLRLSERALALAPADYRIHRNLGTLFGDAGDIARSIEAFTEAARLNPDSAHVRGSLAAQRLAICDWADRIDDENALLGAIRSGKGGVDPFTALLLGTTAADQLACAQQYVVMLGTGPKIFAAPAPRTNQKIRLGYFSGDFREHPVAHLSAELFELHDRSKFEVIGYSYGVNDQSEPRIRIEKGFDKFVDVQSLSDRAVAERIAGDGIDILIDLSGYTDRARAGVACLRPAPIQVNYLGFPGTLGAKYIDYIIADDFVLPPEHRPFYTEQPVYLPDCYQVNDSKRAIAAETPTRAECGLPEEGFVFCCFNNCSKITPVVFAAWMNLLRQAPGSVLWLLGMRPLASENLRKRAAAVGVAPERLVFAPRLPLAAHLARHRLADLFLDTLPYNAHTTMSDALWAGLPAVTCVGDTFAGRVGGSLLRAVGLHELVTTKADDYEALALSLATDPDRLKSLSQKLARDLPTAPLFDSHRFTRHLETAYTRMHEFRRAGKPPEMIVVT